MIIMTLKEIADYCKEKFPDSCLAYNYPKNGTDNEYLLKELHNLFMYEIIGICGCGCPEECERDVRNLLRVYSESPMNPRRVELLNEHFGVESVYDSSLLQFMVYVLNHVDLLDHGTGIGGSWITKLGKMCLYVLEQLDLDNLERND